MNVIKYSVICFRQLQITSAENCFTYSDIQAW